MFLMETFPKCEVTFCLDSTSIEAYVLEFVCLLHSPACPVQAAGFRGKDIRLGDRTSGFELSLCLFLALYPWEPTLFFHLEDGG